LRSVVKENVVFMHATFLTKIILFLLGSLNRFSKSL